MKKILIFLFVLSSLFFSFHNVLALESNYDIINTREEAIYLADNENGNEPPVIGAKPKDCSGIRKIADPIWRWMKIIAPIIAITLGTMDLLKAVASEDQKAAKKAGVDFAKRIGFTFLLFLLPMLVNLLLGLILFDGDLSACLTI